MVPYVHKVQYYETDMMGLTHHSNYIRWMEEARIDFMDQMGYPYTRMESEGILSPVRSLSCSYKRPTTFGDVVSIDVSVESFTGARLILEYRMTSQDGTVVCEARSEHAFINKEGRVVRLDKEQPEFCEALKAMSGSEAAE
jgi:acyl-CoA thioester hydrolase